MYRDKWSAPRKTPYPSKTAAKTNEKNKFNQWLAGCWTRARTIASRNKWISSRVNRGRVSKQTRIKTLEHQTIDRQWKAFGWNKRATSRKRMSCRIWWSGWHAWLTGVIDWFRENVAFDRVAKNWNRNYWIYYWIIIVIQTKNMNI